MKEFILVIFMSIGPFSDKDSMALTTVPGFATEKECMDAGSKAIAAFTAGTKQGKFVCVAKAIEKGEKK